MDSLLTFKILTLKLRLYLITRFFYKQHFHKQRQAEIG